MTQADIGVYGLGTMGSALALNLAENGFQVAVSNREQSWIAPFVAEAAQFSQKITPCDDLEGFVAALKTPRVVLFMIPSGAPLDAMIAQIAPLLQAGDTVVDAGNANFHDTRRRDAVLQAQDIHFVGMGVSGGETGARHGPSMMVGGSAHSWGQLRPMVEAVAARYQDMPCVAHLGTDGAGHFVKTVHNGIEYADMQMIAEIYGVLRDAAGWPAARIGAVFDGWNTGPLRSYLIEITGKALQAIDPLTAAPMVDVIVDQAGQKGTGRWTVIEALQLGQSASGIEAAVGARSWSALRGIRAEAAQVLPAGVDITDLAAEAPSVEDMEQALIAARILSHAQGFEVLRAASAVYGWSLDLARTAEIWRAGCIIRSALLDDIAVAFRADPVPALLILDKVMRERLEGCVPALRRVVCAALASGLPVPAFAAVLGWYDSMRQARGTTNLIQAQRDFFGAHGFERFDQPGKQHAEWPA